MFIDLDRIKQLEKEIQYHNKRYWEDNDPKISDVEYDLLVEELRSLDPNNPALSALPSSEASGSDIITHRTPMLSLDKCYTDQEMNKWLSRFPMDVSFICSPKIDGVACSLLYDEQGKLLYASTRGDGLKGEAITQAVLSMNTIPKSIPSQGVIIEVRGEVYMDLEAFKAHRGLKSPRNACAGALKRKEAQDNQAFGLRFYAYDVQGVPFKTLSGCLDEIETWGFEPVLYTVSSRHQDLIDRFHLYQQRYTEKKLSYDIDGMVYRVNDREAYELLGATSHHPRGAIAYKLKGDSASTYLRDIHWSISRYGVLTPVGIVDPVLLNGASVARVSLHNLNFIRQNKIHTLNSKVVITRSGGVIPHFNGVLEQGDQSLTLPVKCPYCEGETHEIEGFLYCDGKPLCPSVNKENVKHFIKTAKIEGLGDVWVDTLTEKGILSSPVDLFEKITPISLKGIEGVGEIRIKGWLSEIEKAKDMPLDLFLKSLSVKALGNSLSKIMAEQFKSIDNILSALTQPSSSYRDVSLLQSKLESLDGMGALTALAVCKGLTKRSALIQELRKHINVKDYESAEQISDKLSGQSFVFTGTLVSMKRSEAQAKVLALGGDCPSSVSKSLTYLVVGDAGKAGSKLTKASKLGVKVLSETEFTDLVD